jgi:ferredoxin
MPEKLAIHVLSGTGNTRRCASWIAEAAVERGRAVTLAPMEAGPPEPDTPLVVAMPTHGFTVPWAMIKWLAQLPPARGAPAWVLCTRAGVKVGPFHPPGASSSAPFLAALLLTLRGYRVRGAMSVNMPSNWMTAHPPQREPTTQAIVDRSRPIVQRFAQRLLDGKRHWLSLNLLYEAVLGLCLAPVSAIYLPMGRIFLGKLFMANPRCTGCGLCAQACPVGALEMKRDRPYWTWHCESCMRCIAFCPHSAIDCSHLWALLATVVTSVPALLFFLAPWLFPTPLVWALGITAFIVWNYAAMFAGYALFARLILRPGWNRVAWWGALWRRFRRYREPGTRLATLRRSERLGEG